MASGIANRETYAEDERPSVRQIAAFVESQAQQLSAMAEPMLAVDDE